MFRGRYRNTVVAAAIVLGASALAMPPAAAQWYAGVNVGQSHIDYDSGRLASDLAAAGVTGTGSVSNHDTAFKLFAGYQFNPSFAVEAGYFDLGKFTFNGTYSAPAPGGTFSGNVKSDGFSVDAVGRLPFGAQFSGFGRLGVAFTRTTGNASASSGGFTAFANATSNKTVLDAGLGLQYDFTPAVGMRAEWQRYFDVGNNDTGHGDVDLYSVGVVYRF